MNMKIKAIIHGIIPAFLLAVSVGQIYAFTNFSGYISDFIIQPLSTVQLAFSFGIFFLGMGAAFFGKIVERNIKLSTIIGTVLFITGLCVSALSIELKSIWLLYIGYGLLIGLGTGVIYISPVKTMMMWYPNHKFLASAIPIIFFGLGSTFSTLVFPALIQTGISKVFYYYALIYLLMMLPAIFLLKKPIDELKLQEFNPVSFSYRELLRDRFFIHSWLFMFLNISAGLCMIPLARQMMQKSSIGYSFAIITWIISLAGLFNGGGRFVFAFISDRLNKKIDIVGYILGISLITTICCLLYQPVIGIAFLIINACYGAGFSVIPGILSNHYGMNNISKIHGAVLSAWGFAGLFGNQIAIMFSEKLNFGNGGVIVLLIAMYAINLMNFFLMKANYERKFNN